MDCSNKIKKEVEEVVDAESDSASSFISVRSALSVRSAESQSRLFRKRPRTDAKGSGADSSSGEEAASAPKVSTRKRGGGGNLGRGRPAQVKTERAAGPAKEAQRTGVAPLLSESSAEEVDSGAALMKQYAGFMGVVGAVVKAAATRKKAFLRQQVLERAAGQIIAAARTSFGGPSSEELAKIREEVAQLTAEVAKLRRENEELRAEARSRECAAAVAQKPRPPSPPAPKAQPRAQPVARPAAQPRAQPEAQQKAQPKAQSRAQTEAQHGGGQQSERRDLAELLRQEMAALMAKFSAIEGRLLRPPLAGDKKGSYAAVAAAAKPGPSGQETPVHAPAGNAPKKGAKTGRGPKQAAPPAPAKGAAPGQAKVAAAPTQAKGVAQKTPEEGWEVVGAKAKKGKAARKRAQKARRAAKKAAASLRAPRSAAVVVTLQPGAEEKGVTYRDVISKARTEMGGLEELGIPGGLRFKTTLTGARLLEVPGASSGPKADALAEKLRATLDADVVRVTRPTKCVDLRILGLDDSVSAEEVVAAAARVGGCEVGQIKPGPIRSDSTGLGTIVVACPVAAANKIVGGRRLLVGWVSAQVKLLEPRPLRCFRCLTGKHVGVRCTSEADRDRVDRCFRCSQPGHKAGSCTAAPHCAVCAGAGKPADHRAGGKACTAPTRGKGKGKPKGSPATAAAAAAAVDTAGPPASTSQRVREEAMES